MKALLAAIVLIIFAIVLAENADAQTTVTFGFAPCSSGVWCANVPNDLPIGSPVLVYGSLNGQDIGVNIGSPDGSHVDYMSGLHANGTIYAGACGIAPNYGIITVANVRMVSAVTGGVATLVSATFHCVDYISHSGRGPGSHQVWSLMSNARVVLPL